MGVKCLSSAAQDAAAAVRVMRRWMMTGPAVRLWAAGCAVPSLPSAGAPPHAGAGHRYRLPQSAGIAHVLCSQKAEVTVPFLSYSMLVQAKAA